MESNKMDELFRRQLKDHEVSVSAEAWNSLQAAREGKKKAFPWWMLAASLVLLISASLYFTQQPKQAPEGTLLAEEGPLQEDSEEIGSMEQEYLTEAREEQPLPESSNEMAVVAREASHPPLSTKPDRARQDLFQQERVKLELVAIQTQISKPFHPAFDPETIVVPEYLAAPKKVIESAGLKVEIYQNLTAPDSVKKAVAQQKNLLKRVVNAALDVKNGEKELSEVIDLGKLVPPLERKNN